MKKKITLASVTRYAELKSLTRLVLLSAIALIMSVNLTQATSSTIRTEKDNGIRGAGIYDLNLTMGVLPFKKIQAEISLWGNC